jgi:hypothetical protein
MKSLKSLLNRTFGFAIFATLIGSSGFIIAQSSQAKPLQWSTDKFVLMADTRAVPLALVGKYVGNLKPINGCGAVSAITIIIADNGSVSATTTNISGPSGISALLSTSAEIPFFAGEYISGSSQGFWQGQIIGKEIIGGAGAGSCRFVFSGVKKVP